MSEQHIKPDLDFTDYLASRREQQKRPVVVKLSDSLTLHFTAIHPATVLMDYMLDEADINEFRAMFEYFKVVLPDAEYKALKDLAADPTSGLDTPGINDIYQRVLREIANRPTPELSPVSPLLADGGDNSN